MFDIGIGEILLIAVVGLAIFGPEKLPKAAADAAKWLKQIRGMAANARQDLADSAGIDLSDTVDTVKSFSDLHPRNLAKSMFDDSAPPPAKPSSTSATSASSATSAANAPKADQPPLFDPDAT